MGAAASSVDLTPEQRALITSDVEEKYKIMTTEESKSHEVAVEELTKIYGTKTPVVVNGTVVPPPVTESPAPSVGPPVNQSPMTPSRVLKERRLPRREGH